MKYMIGLLAFIFISTNAQACPFCNSKTATDIRAILFGPDVYFNIAVTLLPFAIFSIIIYIIYHGRLPFANKINHSKTN